MCFESADALVKRGQLADVAINGTMDQQHVATTIPLLEAGYGVLLEEPFAVNIAELHALEDAARRTGRKVMICHVLRYTLFYAAIKQRIIAGEIGEIVDIQTAEHVSYHHFSMGYVRGKAKTVGVTPGTQVQIEIQWKFATDRTFAKDGNDAPFLESDFDFPLTSDGYQELSMAFTAPGGLKAASIFFKAFSSTGGKVYFADLEIFELNPKQ